MRVIVLRGLPGSGKSRFALNLIRTENQNHERVHVVSADHFFDKGLGYKFDPTKLGEAHNQCLRRYASYVADPGLKAARIVVVVDNTNLSVVEMAPYMALASAFGISAEIVEFVCSVDEATQRNIHNVPRDVIASMDARRASETANIPRWWKHRWYAEQT